MRVRLQNGKATLEDTVSYKVKCTNAYNGFIHRSLELEASKMSSTVEWINKLFTSIKVQAGDSQNNMDVS